MNVDHFFKVGFIIYSALFMTIGFFLGNLSAQNSQPVARQSNYSEISDRKLAVENQETAAGLRDDIKETGDALIASSDQSAKHQSANNQSANNELDRSLDSQSDLPLEVLMHTKVEPVEKVLLTVQQRDFDDMLTAHNAEQEWSDESINYQNELRGFIQSDSSVNLQQVECNLRSCLVNVYANSQAEWSDFYQRLTSQPWWNSIGYSENKNRQDAATHSLILVLLSPPNEMAFYDNSEENESL